MLFNSFSPYLLNTHKSYYCIWVWIYFMTLNNQLDLNIINSHFIRQATQILLLRLLAQ